MADGLDTIRKLKDPIGTILESWRRPNGMRIERVRVPLGVVGVIYESRPNVTADAGALCLKAGNAVILRGGSESFRSTRAIHAALVEGLTQAELPAAAISLVPTRERAAVGMMLAGLDGTVDVIVPRGGKDLVERVQTEARVPVFAHLEGVCHVYVDGRAKLEMAKAIVLNAKMRRTGVCGAAETLLVDRAGAAKLLKPLLAMLIDAGCEVRGDAAVQAADSRVKPASEADWSTEYLDAILTAGVVDGVDAAIAHIERYGSHHTDAIVTEDGPRRKNSCARWIRRSCCTTLRPSSPTAANSVSAREIGIATGRLHARGPSVSNNLRLSTIAYAARADAAMIFASPPLPANGGGRRVGRGVVSNGHELRVPASQVRPSRWPRGRRPPRAAAACARHAHRPVRRHLRSAARGASRGLPAWR